MMPMSTIQNKKNLQNAVSVKPKVKITDEQSKNIMDGLLQELDNQDAEELEDVNSKALLEELNKPVAFNREEEIMNKYSVTLQPK